MKRTRFWCVKDLIFIYYVHEESLDFGRFIMPGNKLLSWVIFINDLNRLAFCEKEAYAHRGIDTFGIVEHQRL